MQTRGFLRSSVDIYRALWCYAAGRRGELLIAAALLVCAELLKLLLPWLAGNAIDLLQTKGALGLAPAGKQLMLLFLVVVVAWCFHGLGRVLERNVAIHARQALSSTLLECLLRAPLKWHREEHPVAKSQRAIQGTQSLHDFAESQYVYLQSAVQIIGPLVALYLISPVVGISALIGLALLSALSLGFDGVLLRLTHLKNEADRANAASWADTLTFILTVKALRLGAGIHALVTESLRAIFRPLRRIVIVNECKWGAVDVFGNLLWCLLVAIYVVQATSSAPSSGDALLLGSVFMVYEYARRAEGSMVTLAADFSMLAGQLSGFQSAQTLLAAPQEKSPAEQRAPVLWHELQLHGVSTRFESDATAGLGAIELTLQRGSRYALVGASGAGKTTLLMLLAGLETPVAGELTLDGHALGVDELRREATLIPNQTAIFEGTINDNIAPSVPLTSGIAASAVATAGLTEFIATLPHGLQTSVRDGAGRWSAGERQRLALARGVVASAQSGLVLIDEPTNHLDPSSARSVMTALLNVYEDACVVVALHDLDLLSLFDAVIVMASGRVVDVGPAPLLIERSEALRTLLAMRPLNVDPV